MSLYKKSVGRRGEELAAEYLSNNNFEILHKNFRTPLGEIDIIARCADIIHLIEVKFRSSDRRGQPYEAVNRLKLRHIKNAGLLFVKKHALHKMKLSIDIISILVNNGKYDIKHFESVDI